MNDLDYVEIYAKELKADSSLFKQQKRLIESQLQSSRAIFKEKFGAGKDFIINARKYLREIGLLREANL